MPSIKKLDSIPYEIISYFTHATKLQLTGDGTVMAVNPKWQGPKWLEIEKASGPKRRDLSVGTEMPCCLKNLKYLRKILLTSKLYSCYIKLKGMTNRCRIPTQY